ncbi:hypothetical protein A0J57_10345 [Sphingobium sp. 22B]|nr:hypothetical protein A0J57_10345 [Sphingobium sp. 22B]
MHVIRVTPDDGTATSECLGVEGRCFRVHGRNIQRTIGRIKDIRRIGLMGQIPGSLSTDQYAAFISLSEDRRLLDIQKLPASLGLRDDLHPILHLASLGVQKEAP